MAHWIRAWHHLLLGEFLAAGEAGKNVGDIGESSGDRRLQSYGACIAGWIAILSGNVTAGIEALEQAATLAPDPLALAVVLSILGEGHSEAGDSDRAKHRLERALELVRQFHMPQMESWTLCRLSTAYLQEGRYREAHELASKALVLAQAAAFPLGEGLAHRAIGRTAAMVWPSRETSRSLEVALGIFSRLEARYEMARTHLDVAGVARRLGEQEELSAHLNAARNAFQSLSLPGWVARTGVHGENDAMSPSARR